MLYFIVVICFIQKNVKNNKLLQILLFLTVFFVSHHLIYIKSYKSGRLAPNDIGTGRLVLL